MRMGRSPCGERLFYQPAHLCRGGYLIRPAEELHKSAFSLAKRDSFSVWLRPARRGIVFPLAQLGPQPSRWRQAVSWRLCRLETAYALRVLCRFTDGAYPLQVNAFLLTTVLLRGRISYPPGRETSQICFFLRRKGSPSLFCWLRLAQLGIVFSLTQQGPQPSRWRPCRLTDGAYPLRVKPLFLFSEKKKRFWTPKKKR